MVFDPQSADRTWYFFVDVSFGVTVSPFFLFPSTDAWRSLARSTFHTAFQMLKEWTAACCGVDSSRDSLFAFLQAAPGLSAAKEDLKSVEVDADIII
jgi:hypothetical protein